jgi:hypothetical protein
MLDSFYEGLGDLFIAEVCLGRLMEIVGLILLIAIRVD